MNPWGVLGDPSQAELARLSALPAGAFKRHVQANGDPFWGLVHLTGPLQWWSATCGAYEIEFRADTRENAQKIAQRAFESATAPEGLDRLCVDKEEARGLASMAKYQGCQVDELHD